MIFCNKLFYFCNLLIISLLLSGCFPPESKYTESDLKLLANLNPPIIFNSQKVSEVNITFNSRMPLPASSQNNVENNVDNTNQNTNKNKLHQDSRPPLMFIHGSPGSADDWRHYLVTNKLQKYGKRIALNRPGFGEATKDNVEFSLRKQAQYFAELISTDKPTIVVGHSLGGPIAAWMGIDYPEKVCAIVSINGSLAPEFEDFKWYNYLADLPIINNIISEPLRRSNNEMMVLQDELLLLEKSWDKLTVPIILAQSAKDKLVNPQTVNLVLPLINKNLVKTISWQNEGHMIIWDNPDLVIEMLEQLNFSCK